MSVPLKRFHYRDIDRKERYIDPTKKDTEPGRISEAKEDAYDSMLNLILTHKKEIVKVPECSSLATATEWASKRPGYQAGLAQLDGEGPQEVVVWDRNGNPYIINGYKLKTSDFGVRQEYYTANPTRESRTGYPMRAWAQEKLYNVKPDPENPWRVKSVGFTDLGNKLKAQKWKLPTKPKLQQSVYAIFSKLISGMVKDFFDNQTITLKRGQETRDLGPSCVELIRKIVSPITIYRYLYMKLVLRNYFFQMVAEGKIKKDYGEFQTFLKQYKNKFFDWFCQNVLDKNLTDFNPARIAQHLVNRNMVDGSLDIDGSDVNDGLRFLIGEDNLKDENPIFPYNGQNYKFVDIIVVEDVAKAFLQALKSKTDKRLARAVKAFMERFKTRAQRGAKKFFSDRLKQKFFTDSEAEDLWYKNAEIGTMNITSQEAANEHAAAGDASSPIKPSRDVSEDKQMEVVEEDGDGDDDDDDVQSDEEA